MCVCVSLCVCWGGIFRVVVTSGVCATRQKGRTRHSEREISDGLRGDGRVFTDGRRRGAEGGVGVLMTCRALVKCLKRTTQLERGTEGLRSGGRMYHFACCGGGDVYVRGRG